MLTSFTIEKNEYLSRDIPAFYRYEHYGYHDNRTPKYINKLKNDFNTNSRYDLLNAQIDLKQGLLDELIQIGDSIPELPLICVIPRSKVKNEYSSNQLLFSSVINDVLNENFINPEEINGVDCIIRHTNTRTTHLDKSGNGGNGKRPYKGIANDTCTFSPRIKGKHILLIDDIYTKTVNIIEDMAQALFDHGAASVTVFVIGYNMPKY